MMGWKYVSFVFPFYIMFYCMHGVPVNSQNIISDYFYKINCSVVDHSVFNTLNTIECAATCLSDDLCEGFQAVKVNSKLTVCALFNISSATYMSNLDRRTFVKTHFMNKVASQCNLVITTSIYTTDHLQQTTRGSPTSVGSLSSSPPTTSRISTQTTTTTLRSSTQTKTSTLPVSITTTESAPDLCFVQAAIYISTSGEFWLFFNNYLQIYSSLNDLTTTHFTRNNITNIFSDAPQSIEAAYFDGKNVVLIKDQQAYIYETWTNGSRAKNKLSTNVHFGKDVPDKLDAVIVNGKNDLFLFSSNEVTRLKDGTSSKFQFDNNGDSNYYKATNNVDRPLLVTAGEKVDTSTHYIFSRNTIVKFTEGNRGTWNNIGTVSCSQ